MSNRQSLEAICGLAFLDSLREQGTKLQDADAAQLSVAFHAAAEAVAAQLQEAMVDGCLRELESRNAILTTKMAAVIEAARAAKPELRAHAARHFELFGNSNPYYKHPLGELLDALEALDSEEVTDGE